MKDTDKRQEIVPTPQQQELHYNPKPFLALFTLEFWSMSQPAETQNAGSECVGNWSWNGLKWAGKQKSYLLKVEASNLAPPADVSPHRDNNNPSVWSQTRFNPPHQTLGIVTLLLELLVTMRNWFCVCVSWCVCVCV